MRRTIRGSDGLRHYVRDVSAIFTRTGCGLEVGGVEAHDAMPETVTCFVCLSWDPQAEQNELRARFRGLRDDLLALAPEDVYEDDNE